MITRVEALNYRTLRYVNQPLSPFQVLIGPNASGKSTFLDTIAFVAEVIKQPSLDYVLDTRSANFDDLTWKGETDWFELAIEAQIPTYLKSAYPTLRYEIRIGVLPDLGEVGIVSETLWFIAPDENTELYTLSLFPMAQIPPERITGGNRNTPKGWRKIVQKNESGNDYFRSETTDWNNQFRFGHLRSALASVPADTDRFKVASWFKQYIAEGVQTLMLNSEAMRKASPPVGKRAFQPDGSNLPRVVAELTEQHPALLADWVRHIQTVLPDVRAIRTQERAEDRYKYLVVEYEGGHRVPSWMLSDGTLRLLALTILAYLPDLEGVYLIEEPENGIHPLAIEAVLQSLSSVYNAQVLVATHSPIVLSLAQPADLLCFARTNGESAIVRGDQHPRLTHWQHEVSLATLFASGVLG